MTTAINARPWVYTAQFQAKPGPAAVPHPKEAAAEAANQSGPSSANFASAASEAGIGASVAAGAAQEPQADAQEGPSSPDRDPGLQGETLVFGDITGDNELNHDDIQALMQAFNQSVNEADLNGDGNVNTADLGILIRAISELNQKNRPDTTPGDTLADTLNPHASAVLGFTSDDIAKQKAASDDPQNPFSETIGGSGDPVSQPGVFGDLTGDGVVNGDDMDMLKQSFGSGSAVGDLNGDGRVDTADLGSMIGLLNKPQDD